jgi:tight adherence protein C
MDIWWIKALGLTLFFAGVFALAANLLLAAGQRFAAHAAPGAEEDPFGESAGLAGALKPYYGPLAPLVSPLVPERYRLFLLRRLTTAGIERQVGPGDFATFQAVMVPFFCLLGWLFKHDAATAAFFGFLGLVYPYWWLYDKMVTRQKDITVSMPDTVDMLALSTASGLDFLAGLRRICEMAAGRDPFVAELMIVQQNIKLGMSAEDALKVMAERVDTSEMHAFVAILVQAQKMGSSISEVLKAQAERMRQDRFMRAERAGAAAAQKLLVPMMLFLFPIIFCVVFGPYVLKFIYNR